MSIFTQMDEDVNNLFAAIAKATRPEASIIAEVQRMIELDHNHQQIETHDNEVAIFPVQLNLSTLGLTVEVCGSITREVTKYTPRTRENDSDVELSQSAHFIGEMAAFDKSGDLFLSRELNFIFKA